ncbi:MAG TPA: LapA family protein [Rhizobacter sp.]|nr:LapA family protein [Rhizobacter sp.]
MTRALSLIAVLLLIGVFALLNWTAFTAPTTLSLFFTTVQAPLGIIMLGLLFLLALLFTTWAITQQAGMLIETRRHTRELQTQRELADKAEASRFVELRAFLSAELLRVSQSSYEARADLLARMDRLHDETRLSLEQQANSLAATIAELDDRLERGHLPPPEITARGDVTPPLRR